MAISKGLMKRIVKVIGSDLEERSIMVSDALKKPRAQDTLVQVIGSYASPSKELSSTTHPSLMEDLMDELLDSLQKGRVQDLVVSSIMRNFYSAKLTAFAPRFSTSFFSNSMDLDVVEPVFAVHTLTDEDNGVPQHAFTFTVSEQYGFRFHNLLTETAKKSKVKVQQTLMEVVNQLDKKNKKATAVKKTTTTAAKNKKNKVQRLHA